MGDKRRSGLGYWVRLSVSYYKDPAIRAAGTPAEILFVRGIAEAGLNGSDGVLYPEDLKRVRQDIRRFHDLSRRLRSCGLWEDGPIPGSIRIRSWDKWNSPRETFDRAKAQDAARKRKARANQKGKIMKETSDRTSTRTPRPPEESPKDSTSLRSVESSDADASPRRSAGGAAAPRPGTALPAGVRSEVQAAKAQIQKAKDKYRSTGRVPLPLKQDRDDESAYSKAMAELAKRMPPPPDADSESAE